MVYIRIEVEKEKDYPSYVLADDKFLAAMKASVYRRLELRASDIVEVIVK